MLTWAMNLFSVLSSATLTSPLDSFKVGLKFINFGLESTNAYLTRPLAPMSRSVAYTLPIKSLANIGLLSFWSIISMTSVCTLIDSDGSMARISSLYSDLSSLSKLAETTKLSFDSFKFCSRLNGTRSACCRNSYF
ncbi:hypothetical protein BpHYR1_019747 [Brachionus plicatilis]|uniref:Secreted protein n=1 Tax=Brachionus plicatilis TaxID=10195 RepID=A0A3M7RYZ4_BRAPC|nr:hypothetical protein BpHYR1_019747 [Brachionus plicatilis]